MGPIPRKGTLACRKKEADKGSVELARRDCSLSKTCNDQAKLLIESKCVLDRLIDENSHLDVKDIKVPALQLSEKGATVPSKAGDIAQFRTVKLTLDVVECTLAKKNNDDSDDSDNNDDDSDTSHNDNDTSENDGDNSDEDEWLWEN
ncbi:hypothetical protein BDA99DRAFT_565646 [Phascolomyces articulosus]|uniref:Uncharacterized protein n=1 Tax=Phascolomyces articulosus TaxID=60185 RepID=A0AAD5JYT5_9FUNG|nr:hypothetical protein BDA99DRAFT_565646 [Phascolomyces articulosus]